MSVTDQGGWGEVERRAQAHESREHILTVLGHAIANEIKVTTEDRLRGAIVAALSELERGWPTSAHQTLSDALKIK